MMLSVRELTGSELDWLRVRGYLREHRHGLAVRAAGLYPEAVRVAGTPLLAAREWLPAEPVPLERMRRAFRAGESGDDAGTSGDGADGGPAGSGTEAGGSTAGVLPRRADGTRYPSYADAVRTLDAPAVFENRPVYRLTGAGLTGDRPGLAFTRGRYFDSINTGAAVAHEYAAAELGPPGAIAAPGSAGLAALPLRAAFGDPCDLRARPAAMAVATLTLRADRQAGAAFPLHWRDPGKVGHAGGMYQVIPTGIFQPSGEAAWNERNDFDLWRCMLREYAEELLGADDSYDSERAPIDYQGWDFGQRMSAARAAGRIRVWCVGLGVDPLTFATDLLTVAVIDAEVYDGLFSGLVGENAEGTVIGARPFDPATVSGLISEEPVQAAGAALLALAIRHARMLLR